ncbi:hypothetical protein LTR37_013429 [Vermiconidia calcicola]|uniref:Uncharacterized protein n=1 Tax=Vermiconidia calcicola TaxID=1690605 RepID=A0ACC3MWC7_9PEZI|nr:hypothetical protein LTR37_013429 [Vermiconidia calcicola]
MAVKIAVFDELFKETLESCGLKGMSPGALNSQWSENKPERRGYSWFAFLIEPISEDQVGKRRLMKAAIARIKERLLECGSPSTSGTPSQMRQPIPGIEKRKRITSAEPRSPNGESESDTYGARPKRARKRVVPFEELPRTDRAAASSKTPSRAPPRLATTTEKLLLERRAGPDLPLLPERHKIASDPWEAPSEEAAHPPLSGLLFRFWSSTSQGLNSEQGFVAARYRDSNIWPSQPPRSCQLDEADLVHHINGYKHPSPFVSVSNFLPWSLRNALKEVDKGSPPIRITVLSASALDPARVFYAAPFVAELKEDVCPHQSSAEVLGFPRVPGMARHSSELISTASLAQLVEISNRIPEMGFLRLKDLSMKGDHRKVILPLFKSANVRIDPVTTTAIAKLAMFFGLSSTSSVDELSHLVSDVTKGFGLCVRKQTREHWRQLSATFAHVFIRNSVLPIDIRDQVKLREAFVIGVAEGLGEFNVRHNAERMQKMLKLAERLGLNDAKILSDECDGAKLHAWMHRKSYQRRFLGMPSQLLLADGVDEAQEESEGEGVNVAVVEEHEDERIIYEHD